MKELLTNIAIAIAVVAGLALLIGVASVLPPSPSAENLALLKPYLSPLTPTPGACLATGVGFFFVL